MWQAHPVEMHKSSTSSSSNLACVSVQHQPGTLGGSEQEIQVGPWESYRIQIGVEI